MDHNVFFKFDLFQKHLFSFVPINTCYYVFSCYVVYEITWIQWVTAVGAAKSKMAPKMAAKNKSEGFFICFAVFIYYIYLLINRPNKTYLFYNISSNVLIIYLNMIQLQGQGQICKNIEKLFVRVAKINYVGCSVMFQNKLKCIGFNYFIFQPKLKLQLWRF